VRELSSPRDVQSASWRIRELSSYHVIVVVCLFVRLFVCLLATLSKNVQTDVHEIFGEDWQWANEHLITFWW